MSFGTVYRSEERLAAEELGWVRHSEAIRTSEYRVL